MLFQKAIKTFIFIIPRLWYNDIEEENNNEKFKTINS
jgi:hypothetical protein